MTRSVAIWIFAGVLLVLIILIIVAICFRKNGFALSPEDCLFECPVSYSGQPRDMDYVFDLSITMNASDALVPKTFQTMIKRGNTPCILNVDLTKLNQRDSVNATGVPVKTFTGSVNLGSCLGQNRSPNWAVSSSTGVVWDSAQAGQYHTSQSTSCTASPGLWKIKPSVVNGNDGQPLPDYTSTRFHMQTPVSLTIQYNPPHFPYEYCAVYAVAS